MIVVIVVDENNTIVNHVDVDMNIDDLSEDNDYGSDDGLMVWISRISLVMDRMKF